MLSRAAVKGKRIYKSYRIAGYENRDRVGFRLMPRTIQLLEWLAKKNWVPRREPRNAGRVIDHLARIYLYHVDKRKFIRDELSTEDKLRLMVEMGYGASISQVLDWITGWAYKYEGGRRKAY